MKFWICVVSKEHALKAIEGGIVQACHGKASPLKRMKIGDLVTFYCPSVTFMGKDKYQKFLGIGRVADDHIYQFEMSVDFKPFRMNIEYLENSIALEASIHNLINSFEFIKDKKHWGYMFRFGHFEISKTDFELILNAMNILDNIFEDNANNDRI